MSGVIPNPRFQRTRFYFSEGVAAIPPADRGQHRRNTQILPPRIGTEAANSLPKAASNSRPTYQRGAGMPVGTAIDIRRSRGGRQSVGLVCCKFCNNWIRRLGGETAVGTASRISTDLNPRSPVSMLEFSNNRGFLLDGKAENPWPNPRHGRRGLLCWGSFSSLFRPPPWPSTGGGGFVWAGQSTTAIAGLLLQIL